MLNVNVKLFPDDTSLFSIVNDANKYFQNLSNDLCIISSRNFKFKSPNTRLGKIAEEESFAFSYLNPFLTNSEIIYL